MQPVKHSPEPEPFEPQVGRSVSIEHAAQILRVSRRTVYNRIRDGKLQTVRTLGGSQRIVMASLDEVRRPPLRDGDRSVLLDGAGTATGPTRQ